MAVGGGVYVVLSVAGTSLRIHSSGALPRSLMMFFPPGAPLESDCTHT